MTIDMLRHRSLRSVIAGDIPTIPCLGVAHAYCFRNLAVSTPEEAADVMESTVALAPELKRRAGRRVATPVRKPALAYTVYWEYHCPGEPMRLITDSIDIVGATDLQAVIAHCSLPSGPATTVILNTVHPKTGLASARGQVYFNLLCWHLKLEGDPAALEALNRGRFATIIESLLRQDLDSLRLPERIVWFLEGTRMRIGSGCLAMFLRCGPSGW